MQLRKVLSCSLLFFALCSFGQNEYAISFTDKMDSEFDPYEYFDPKAIERRTNKGIDLYDISDFPVSPTYYNYIDETGVSITGNSRWLNMVFCIATESQLEIIKAFPFVKDIQFLPESELEICAVHDTIPPRSGGRFKTKEVLIGQKAVHQGNLFVDANITGKGIRIAIFDVGFNFANSIPELKQVFADKRMILSYDFVKSRPVDFNNGGGTHGTNVMSCIAGIHKKTPLGFASGAEFLLARTEKAFTEKLKEEKNWLMAAEWADKNGADIINSSLGYTNKRYYQNEMDGKTTLVTRAANFAASKGILVVNAAGNEGNDSWRTIGAPADSDSVLAVGGISPYTGFHIDWSSYGPTADKRLKPNVSAFGLVVVADKMSGTHTSQGTSFSSPLMAGFAACVLELNPTWDGMRLMEEIQMSGHLYPYFDYAHGYGLPQASYFFSETKQEAQTKTFTVENLSEILYVTILDDYIPEQILLEKELNKDSSKEDIEAYYSTLTSDYLYYHIENSQGYVSRYKVNNVDSEKGASINLIGLKGNTIRIFFKNYYYEYKVE